MLGAATDRGGDSINRRDSYGAILHQSCEGKIVASPFEVDVGIAQHDRAPALDVRKDRRIGLGRFADLEFELELPLPVEDRVRMWRGSPPFTHYLPSTRLSSC